MRWRWPLTSPWRSSCLFPVRCMASYLALLIVPMEKFIGPDRPFVYIPVLCSVAVVMLGWPQVAFALLGGFLVSTFRITITRR